MRLSPTSSGAKRPTTSHTNFFRHCCDAFPYAGMLRWSDVHTHNPKVTMHVERMLYVPRNVGSGCHEAVGSSEVAPYGENILLECLFSTRSVHQQRYKDR
jgi:hypothetical protein